MIDILLGRCRLPDRGGRVRDDMAAGMFGRADAERVLDVRLKILPPLIFVNVAGRWARS